MSSNISEDSTELEPLSLDTPWALGEQQFALLIRELQDESIERLIEFGSGISTIRLSKRFHDAEIISIEDSPMHLNRTQQLIDQNEIKNVNLLLCPLVYQRIGLRAYRTYDLRSLDFPGMFDCALIDGPVESSTICGREAVLYLIYQYLKEGAIIALDDYQRERATRSVANWLNCYTKNLIIESHNERIIFLRKLGHQARPGFPGIESIHDNITAQIRFFQPKLKGKAKLEIRRWISKVRI